MSSSAVLEPTVQVHDRRAVSDLLVLWQHPESRQIMPIGRLHHEGERYVFGYTRMVVSIEGFRPLPGLGEVMHRYDMPELPTVFRQRVLDPERPDYTAYLRQLGLDPQMATPWEQIVHSGGERAGDTLQFMEVPRVVDGVARARFFANGVRHVPDVTRSVAGRHVHTTAEEHESAMVALRPGDTLLIEPEDGNPFDSCASLVTSEGVPLGWVPQAISAGVRELCERGETRVTVVRVGGPEVPAHQRLVLELAAAAPGGFAFDRDGRWEVLAA